MFKTSLDGPGTYVANGELMFNECSSKIVRDDLPYVGMKAGIYRSSYSSKWRTKQLPYKKEEEEGEYISIRLLVHSVLQLTLKQN